MNCCTRTNINKGMNKTRIENRPAFLDFETVCIWFTLAASNKRTENIMK